MTSSKPVTRLALSVCLAAGLAACASPPTLPETGSLRVQQASMDAHPANGMTTTETTADKDKATIDKAETAIDKAETKTDSGIVMAGTLSEGDAKLYAKGFQDGYQDAYRSLKADKKRKHQLLKERRAADRTGARYQSPLRSDTPKAMPGCETSDGEASKTESQPTKQSQPALIAETGSGQD